MSRALVLFRVALVPLLLAVAVVTTSNPVVAVGTTQVSNIGRASDFTASTSTTSGSIGNVLYAGKFTTGTVASVLTGAQAVLNNSPALFGTATYEARIYADAGNVPGSLLVTFDNNPTNTGSGFVTQSFDISAGYGLAASTSYWLAIRNTSGGYFGWRTTTDDGEDSLDGWTIDNSAVARSVNTGSSWADQSSGFGGRVPQFAIQIQATPIQICQPGTYSADGNEPCTPAPAGSFVATAGATEATLCAVGTFSAVTGAVACTPAPVGSFVDTAGAVAATLCPVGRFSDSAGAAACTPAPAGSFVDTPGATEATPCPAGKTTAGVGSTSVDDCSPINLAPTAVAGGPYLVAVGASIDFDGSASSDPDEDSLTEKWTAGGETVAGSTYTAGDVPGIFDVCLTVNDGTVDSDESCTFVVVYDPSAGFVTGGGWIDSPAGAYTADPDLAGKANFGFVAKYKKGANVPDGNTQFQFKAGDLNFHSTSYDWLVVAGDTAKFKGEGTVNGQGGYTFQISADDDDPDTFRIQIWGDGGIVYDNGSQQTLGGGSIQVHNK